MATFALLSDVICDTWNGVFVMKPWILSKLWKVSVCVLSGNKLDGYGKCQFQCNDCKQIVTSYRWHVGSVTTKSDQSWSSYVIVTLFQCFVLLTQFRGIFFYWSEITEPATRSRSREILLTCSTCFTCNFVSIQLDLVLLLTREQSDNNDLSTMSYLFLCL